MSILKRNRIVGGFLLTVSILSSMSVLIIPVNAYTATDSTKTACQTLSGLSSLFYYNTGKWKKAIRGPDLDSAKSSISDSLMSALEGYDSSIPYSTVQEIKNNIDRLKGSYEPTEAQTILDLISLLISQTKPVACKATSELSSVSDIRAATFTQKYLQKLEYSAATSYQAYLGQKYQTLIAVNSCSLGDADSRTSLLSETKNIFSMTDTDSWDVEGSEIIDNISLDRDQTGADVVKLKISSFFKNGDKYISSDKKKSNIGWNRLIAPSSIKLVTTLGCRSGNANFLLRSRTGYSEEMDTAILSFDKEKDILSQKWYGKNFSNLIKAAQTGVLKSLSKSAGSDTSKQLAKGALTGY